MSALDDLSALSDANTEAEIFQKLHSPQFWRHLELFRVAYSTASASNSNKRHELAEELSKDVGPRLLFLAIDISFREEEEHSRQKAAEAALLAMFASPLGPRVYESDQEVVPFLLAGLSHAMPKVKILTAKALTTLGSEQPEGRGARCRALLRPPVMPALVTLVGDKDTGVGQAAANALVSLCEVVDQEVAQGATGVPHDDGSCRKAVLAALASGVDEVVRTLSASKASTIRLRFAGTASRLMATSDHAFAAALEVGAVALVTDLTREHSDWLLYLNALDLLDKVASTAGGAQHLLASGHLVGLLHVSGSQDAAPPSPYLAAPSLMTTAKVLGKATGFNVIAWTNLEQGSVGTLFLRACTLHLTKKDDGFSSTAGSAAAAIVAHASDDALRAMLADGCGSGCLLDAWLTLQPEEDAVNAWKLRALALALGPSTYVAADGSHDQITGTVPDAVATEDRIALAGQLFQRLEICNNVAAGELLFRLIRQPLPKIHDPEHAAQSPGHLLRDAAYDLLRCSVWQPGGWGLSAAFSQPGFGEFLERRDAEDSKVTREWKFAVIDAAMKCPERASLRQRTLDAFREILRQGPFYTPKRDMRSRGLE